MTCEVDSTDWGYPVRTGDAMAAVPIEFTDPDNDDAPIPITRFALQILDWDGSELAVWDTDDTGATLLDGAGGLAQIDAIEAVDIPPGQYLYRGIVWLDGIGRMTFAEGPFDVCDGDMPVEETP